MNRAMNKTLSLLTSLLMIVALFAPPQSFADDPKFSIEAFLTYGSRGPKRPGEFVEQESFTTCIRCKNFEYLREREFVCEVTMNLIDVDNNVIPVFPPAEIRIGSLLGGKLASVNVQCPLLDSIKPGKYRLSIEVLDLGSKSKSEATLELTILPINSLAATNIRFVRNPEHKFSAGGCYNVGDQLLIDFAINGAEKNTEGKWDLTSHFTILENDKKPYGHGRKTFHTKVTAPATGYVPALFFATVDQAGTFYAKLEIIDNVSTKTVTHVIPFVVVDAAAL